MESCPSTAEQAEQLRPSLEEMTPDVSVLPGHATSTRITDATSIPVQMTSASDAAETLPEFPELWKLCLSAPSHPLCFWCAGQCQFCPVGWLWDAGQCYYFSSARKSWEQSREDCCSRGAQLVTIQANTTLVSAPSLACPAPCDHWAVLVTASQSLSSHPRTALSQLPGPSHSLPCRIFPIQRYTRSFQACGRVSGLGLLGGACTEALRWVCKQRAATLQWLQSSPPAFLWGNTTYSCVRP
uniref:C-type lectin domain-containing protein n=1 Tax=Catharus ustulatus TaxID=91951 RepID=A0A8C3Y7X8_CATUS